MCGVSHSFSRHKVVDFTEFLYNDEHTFIAQYPSGARREVVQWSYLLQPFDLSIWLAILGTALCLYVAFAAQEKAHNKNNQESSFLKTISIFLMQCKQTL